MQEVSAEVRELEDNAWRVNFAEMTYEQIDEILRSRVAAGIALLNEQEWSEPWYNVINLDTLNISDPGTCVLGQLFLKMDDHQPDTPYLRGLQRLGLDLGIAHGFSGWYQTRLTKIWKEEILKLRENHVQ